MDGADVGDGDGAVCGIGAEHISVKRICEAVLLNGLRGVGDGAA